MVWVSADPFDKMVRSGGLQLHQPLQVKQLPFYLNLTMTTTQEIYGNLFTPFETHHLEQPNMFQRFFRNVGMLFTNSIWCCYSDTADSIRDLVEEQRIKNTVAVDSVRVTRRGNVENALTMYENALFGAPVAVVHEDVTAIVPYGAEPEEPVAADVEEEEAVPALVSTRFVASVRVAVIAKIGMVDDTKDNRKLVSDVARKIMVSIHTRNELLSVTLPHVINTYFDCRQVQEKAGGRRGRTPTWLLKMLGFKVPKSTTC